MWIQGVNTSFLGGILLGSVITHICCTDIILRKIYQAKVNKLEERIEKLEDFRLSMYEKNLLLNEKRHWDEDTSEESDHLSELGEDMIE